MICKKKNCNCFETVLAYNIKLIKEGVQCCFMPVELFTRLKSWILMLNMARI